MSTVETGAPRATSASTGIAGLDNIMAGGFTSRRLFLVEGMPGSGKTTLALQYAMDGARRGESVLYVTLSETEEELRAGAESHGWALDGIEISEVNRPERMQAQQRGHDSLRIGAFAQARPDGRVLGATAFAGMDDLAVQQVDDGDQMHVCPLKTKAKRI